MFLNTKIVDEFTCLTYKGDIYKTVNLLFQRFDSVEDIIQYYKSFPIILIDGKDKTGVHKEQCCLTRPLPLSRHFSPW